MSEIFIVGLFVALGSALFGSLVILKRFALVSDALSHVALPGFALALLFEIHPFFGAIGFLIIAVAIIHTIERRIRVATETLVGVLFTVALAIGAILVPEEELLESLFGDITMLTQFDVWLSVIGGSVLFISTLLLYRRFVKAMVSQELAHTESTHVPNTELLFLLLLVLAVAIGIKAIGTLLMGALIILPAAAAKNISATLKQMVLLSVIFSIVSIGIGLWGAQAFGITPGPSVVLVATVFFIISLFWKR